MRTQQSRGGKVASTKPIAKAAQARRQEGAGHRASRLSPVHLSSFAYVVSCCMPNPADTPLHRIRADLVERLRAYEDGTLTTQTRTAENIEDTTSDTIARIRATIAELNRVIEGRPRR